MTKSFVAVVFTAIWMVSGAAAQTTDGITGSVSMLGTSARVDVSGPGGWACSGMADVPSDSRSGSSQFGGGSRSGSSGGRSSSQNKSPTLVHMSCNDGSTAVARVTRDAARREWDLSFQHKQHGRAKLRVAEH